MKNATLICDLQFGSTGKGLIAGYLAERDEPDTLVTAWSANAGHTYINAAGEKFVHTMIPNGIVSPKCRKVMIGPGSLLNPQNFLDEIDMNRKYLVNADILIHPNAGVINSEHRSEEDKTMVAIGSTKKGCGAALIQKIKRDPKNTNVASECGLIKHYVVRKDEYMNALMSSKNIQIEGAQGFSLSMHHGMYPYTTSRDVTPMQILADCAVPISYLSKVVGSMRTYPIRVANRFDKDGNQVGWSGPCYSDQIELDWNEIGIEPELTTVTKLPRRIFSFSMQQIIEAVNYCEPTEVFLNFANYCEGNTEILALIGAVNSIGKNNPYINSKIVKYIGFGPTINDVIDIQKNFGYLENKGVYRNEYIISKSSK